MGSGVGGVSGPMVDVGAGVGGDTSGLLFGGRVVSPGRVGSGVGGVGPLVVVVGGVGGCGRVGEVGSNREMEN